MKTKKKPISKTILFTRHAIALDQDIAAKQRIADPQRELTAKGKKTFESYVKKHKKLFKNADSFVSSPYVRAKQTLEIVMQLKSARKHKAKVYKFLRPDDSPINFLKYVMSSPSKKIVAVSHEPFMSHFMNALFAENWKAEKIKKGRVIKIRVRGDKVSYKMC